MARETQHRQQWLGADGRAPGLTPPGKRTGRKHDRLSHWPFLSADCSLARPSESDVPVTCEASRLKAALGTLLNYWNNFDRPFLNCFYSKTSPTRTLQVIPVIQQRPLLGGGGGSVGDGGGGGSVGRDRMRAGRPRSQECRITPPWRGSRRSRAARRRLMRWGGRNRATRL